MVTSALLVVFTCLFATVYFILKSKYNYWKKRGIPFIKPTPFVGNYGKYIFLQEQIGEATCHICDQEDAPLLGSFLGTEPLLLVQDPDLIKTVLTKDFYFFSGREHSKFIPKETLFRNIFANYGDEWRVLRQNLTPLFSSAKMKNMFHLIKSCADQFETLLEEEAKSGKSINIKSPISRFSMDCICSCAFGINSNAMGKNISVNPFRKIADTIFEVSYSRALKFVARLIYPGVFYALKQRLLEPEVDEFFNRILKEVFVERKYKPTHRHDFVDAMLTFYNETVITGDSIECMNGGSGKVSLAVDQGILVAQCVAFFAAGFDTTATTLSFTLYELAKHPEQQERAIKEIDEYLNSHGNKLDYSVVTSMPFLESCIDETLRLYPLLGSVPREVYRDYTLPNGTVLEAGLRVHIPVLKLQRNPKYFPDPEKFDPDRFSAERKHEIKPYTYLPFGEGPRICIGMRFAKMMMLSGLTTLFSKYRVEVSNDTPKTITFEPKWVTTYPREELKLSLVPRK